MPQEFHIPFLYWRIFEMKNRTNPVPTKNTYLRLSAIDFLKRIVGAKIKIIQARKTAIKE